MYKLVIEIYHEDEGVLRSLERQFEIYHVIELLVERGCLGCSTTVTNSEEEGKEV